MKRRLFVSLFCGLLLTSSALPADSDEKGKKAEKPKTTKDIDSGKPAQESKADLYARLAEGPAGVCKTEFEKDGKGRIQAVLVVGKSRISTTLGKAKGIEIAQKRAVNDAKGRFLQWLKEEAIIEENQEDETVILLEGAEEEGKEDAKRESGKGIEKNSSKFKSVAQGMIRGLQIVYYNQDGTDKTYTLVMKWSTKSNDAAAQTRDTIDRSDKKDGDKDKDKDKKKKEDKTIPNRRGVIDDDD